MSSTDASTPDAEVADGADRAVEPEPDQQPEQAGSGLLLDEAPLLRVYDSLDREYSLAPSCYPIISPGGALPGADRRMPGDFSPRPWASSRCPNPREFSAYYGVYSQFLPFDYQRDDRVETMTEIMKHLDARPPTAERVAQTILRGPNVLDDDNPALPVEETCLLAGWWPGDWRSSSGIHYLNPDYVHGHDQEHCYTDRPGRETMARLAGALGLRSGDLSPMFGLTSGASVRQILSGYSVPWKEIREGGYRRLGRTVKTIYEWGYTWPEIGAAFGVAPNTAITWRTKYAPEFRPPPDPTDGFERPLIDWVEERRTRAKGCYADAGETTISRLLTNPYASSDLVDVRRHEPHNHMGQNNLPYHLPTAVEEKRNA